MTDNGDTKINIAIKNEQYQISITILIENSMKLPTNIFTDSTITTNKWK